MHLSMKPGILHARVVKGLIIIIIIIKQKQRMLSVCLVLVIVLILRTLSCCSLSCDNVKR